MKKNKYDIWIKLYYPTPQSAYLACEQATKLMVKSFPELKRVRGLAFVKEPYDCPPTKAPHWWCETSDGKIVDPTAHQYPTEILKYSASDESQGPPTGKCINCGDLAYNGSSFCSKKCDKEYVKYLNGFI